MTERPSPRRGGSSEATPPSQRASSTGDATRDRLRHAAVAAFAERGFHATTTRDIAAAAGMSPAALYVHYRSKEEVLYDISATGHLSILRVLESAVAAEVSPTGQLRRLIRDFAQHHASAPTQARIVNYELSALNEEHRAEIRDLRQRTSAVLRTVVHDGVAAGEFDVPDPRLAATALLSLGIDIARWYRAEGDWTPEDVAAAYAAMALRIVGVGRADG